MEPERKRSAALHTCHPCRRTIPYRIYAIIHTCGIISLMYNHAHSLATADTTLTTSLLLIADVVLAFMWATTTCLRFNPIHRTEYPNKYVAKPKEDFPELDVFICTANPYKEPPMMVVNTALSVMAYDYPSDKISVYVSDDGGSSLTLFALMEAAKFSEHWLPFCKKNNVEDRSPEVYFSSKSQYWTDEAENIKRNYKHNIVHEYVDIQNNRYTLKQTMYEDMKKRVEHVVNSGNVDTHHFTKSDQFYDVLDLWTNNNFTHHDHPTIIKVFYHSNSFHFKPVLLNNETEIMPNLMYVSREKSRATPHHFKAGALNTLLRVSSVMTNSPVILTLDCDMFSNNPRTPLHALCYLSDPKINSTLGFVQFPQKFHGINKNDIYASELRRSFVINMVGFDGLMGPAYAGTGCFFNRRAFYGPPTNLILPEVDELGPNWIADKRIKDHDVLALAHNVAGCNYERNSNWGSKIGFRYGSLVEDYYTGYSLHCEGWRSVFCSPPKTAFYGDSPKCLIDVVSQQKRWTIGLLEVAFSRFSPVTYGVRSTGLLTGIGYCQYAFWAFLSIPLVIYGFLPQFALLYGVSVFPKPSDPWFWLYIFLFLGSYGQDLLDFVLEGGTCHGWWNDQRMWLIRGFSSFPFGFIEFTLKTLNLSTHGFNLTSKVNDDDKQSKRYEQEIFDFGHSSTMFFPITMVAIINLFALLYGIYGIFVWDEGLVLELMLVSFAVVNSWPIYMAMVLREDDGKLPKNVCILAGIFACFVVVAGFFVLK
ncbi:hypothetical protein Bca52824_090853 [Brassica carinata]|uniref:Cellulose synthase-like protein G3 n=1 Tax=Brassica carinata TaxID=52824 RepID=A0A8X7NXS8_BRACI|nr:hypothetical protein Bca52824_090853 [Brassica carinata]